MESALCGKSLMMVSLMAGHFIDFVPSHRGPMAFRMDRVCVRLMKIGPVVRRDHVLVARGVKSKVVSCVSARANCIIKQAANESESHSSGRRPFIITVIPIVSRVVLLRTQRAAATNHAKSGLKSVNS
jgi:hypothetical protein